MSSGTTSGQLLFVTLSNIGDAILTTPALKMLHAAMPDKKIDILCDARSRDLFKHCPWQGEIIERNKHAGLRASIAQLKALRARRYSLVVDLRTDGIARLLGARQCLDKLSATYDGVHAVQSHASVVRSLNHGSGVIPLPEIWLSTDERQWWAQRRQQLPGARYLTIAPGANWPGKVWPVQNYVELVNKMSDLFDAVVVLGDTRDEAAGEILREHSDLPVMKLPGQTDLLQAGAVLEHASAFIGNDSGLGHLASAIRCPALTIFGPGRPARYRPWGPLCDWLRAPDKSLASVRPQAAVARLNHLLNLASRAENQ